ncbi:MAG: NAD-dependent epimerase/dehydratase family protein [Acidobacteria bacterium]|nr:NAD-dependent epimerase/dehydratase family protein [Acidobacteriota bacterium]
MFWKNRNAFVTGATGFVGAHVVRKLVENSANVFCLQRDETHPNALDLLELRDKVTVIRGSVDDLNLMSRILNENEIDAVFHLAAQALVGVANRSPFSTFESNVRGTYSLLEACRLNPIVKRIVVASSDKAYGSHTSLPYEEDFALQGLFPYDVSKTCTDLIAQSFAATFDLPLSITRSANIYGEGDTNLSRIIPGTIISVLNGEAPVIRSDGTPVRDFIFSEDIALGYLLLAENAESIKGEAFNFGSGTPVNMLDLANTIIRLLGKESSLVPDVKLKTKIDGEIDAQFLSSAKIKDRLNWEPIYSLEAGLAKTIDWYSENLERIAS